MVGKLIKNEFKASIHSVAPIYIATIAVIAALSVSFLLEIVWLAALSLIAFYLVASCLIFITIISVINQFTKSMFRDQGYLTFTLPVTSGQILFSKALCSFFWIGFSIVTSIAMFAGLFIYIMNQVETQVDETTMLQIETILVILDKTPDFTIILKLLIMALVYFITLVAFIVSEIYFSVTLANVKPFQRMGNLATMIIFTTIFIFTAIVNLSLKLNYPLSLRINILGRDAGIEIIHKAMVESQSLLGFAETITMAIGAVIFFALTAWFMKHKINLK